ncbi:MAG: hypothetical protein ACR2LK_06265 [Solirubrobacteraceae bacterium]
MTGAPDLRVVELDPNTDPCSDAHVEARPGVLVSRVAQHALGPSAAQRIAEPMIRRSPVAVRRASGELLYRHAG